jgi:hypothetical protein
MLWFAAVVLDGLAACRPEKPACAPEALAAIEAQCATDILAGCPTQQTPEECEAYPAIRATCQQRRADWENCK